MAIRYWCKTGKVKGSVAFYGTRRTLRVDLDEVVAYAEKRRQVNPGGDEGVKPSATPSSGTPPR
jgi:hypothetical protein